LAERSASWRAAIRPACGGTGKAGRRPNLAPREGAVKALDCAAVSHQETITMRKSSGILSRAALAAGVGLAACPPATAADLTAAIGRAQALPANTMPDPSLQSKLRDRAIALRADWLARGHSVQQLAATAAPSITGGSVTASTITVGDAGQFPSLTVAYTTDTPGLNFIAVEFASPNGQTFYAGGYATWYYTTSGTLSFAIATPVNLYSSPGAWSLTAAEVIDNAGNFTLYNSTQLKTLFTNLSFTVVNTGPAANAPPTIKAGELLNDTVSLSAQFPVLAATITAKDGTGPGIYQAYVLISPPGGGYSYYSFLPNAKPIKGGKIKANNVFGSYSPTGTWNIVGYGVCDYANNCSGSTSDSAIVTLFGTDTFTVTP
jgi:hypothetical protein